MFLLIYVKKKEKKKLEGHGDTRKLCHFHSTEEKLKIEFQSGEVRNLLSKQIIHKMQCFPVLPHQINLKAHKLLLTA